MVFPQVKDDIKDRCDIYEVINSYVPLKRAGANYRALCPFHNEKTPSFMVNPTRQSYYCFGCQRGGDVISFVMEHEGVDFMGALGLLAQRVGVQIPEYEPASRHDAGSNAENTTRATERKDRLYELHDKIAVWYQKNLRSEAGKDTLEYVRDRGLNDDALVTFGLGYALKGWDNAVQWGRQHGFSRQEMMSGGLLTVKNEDDPASQAYDRFRDRLMFPVWNEQGRIVAFSGRVLTSDSPGGKYVNSPETPIFKKGRILYGLHLARQGIKAAGHAVLCEGQMDVIACHRADVTNAVAPQGTAFTEQQAFLIKRYTENVVLAFDADTAGVNAALKSLDSLAPANLNARVVLMGEGEDPDSLMRASGAESLRQKMADSEEYFRFLLDAEIRRHDTSDAAGKTAVADTFLEAVSKMKSRVVRAEYCQLLASRLQIPEGFVFQQLEAVTNRRRRSAAYRSEAKGAAGILQAALNDSDAVRKSERALLELALHHKSFAVRMVTDLPADYIDDTGYGPVLNEILAHTEQGDWAESEEIVREQIYRSGEHSFGRILEAPEFGSDVDPDKLEKAYIDSVAKIKSMRADAKLRELTQALKSTADHETKRALRQQIQELKRSRPATWTTIR